MKKKTVGKMVATAAYKKLRIERPYWPGNVGPQALELPVSGLWEIVVKSIRIWKSRKYKTCCPHRYYLNKTFHFMPYTKVSFTLKNYYYLNFALKFQP
jgi:hypothetical protein